MVAVNISMLYVLRLLILHHTLPESIFHWEVCCKINQSSTYNMDIFTATISTISLAYLESFSFYLLLSIY